MGKGLNGWISGAIVGGIWNILIMFGIHWAVNTTVVIPNIALLGESPIIAMAAGANFGMAGACLGVWIKSRNKELRSYSISSIASIFLSGIVEPALYGVGSEV
ncbi:PTS transporter subunit EIIC [Lactovum odontotermitis]